MYDVNETVVKTTTYLPFILLAVALVIVLAFEFVNGFYDTAYALATVVYTHSMSPSVAVLWFGFFNFLGVLLSSGAVASGIISLLPVELILQVGSDSGFAMTMIGAADIYGLTVSTTLVLSSGVAGTMAPIDLDANVYDTQLTHGMGVDVASSNIVIRARSTGYLAVCFNT